MKVLFWIITSVALVQIHCSCKAISSGLTQTKSPQDTRVIDSLSVPNDDEIRKILTAEQWHNPYVVVNRDGYELILHDQPRNQLILNLDQLERTLLKMPLERWPLGRVVAVQENGLRSRRDDAGIASNLKALKLTLESLRVRVDQWPS